MEFLRDFGAPELLIIFIIILLLFGPGRIGKVAGELGKSIRSFRDGLSGKGDDINEEAEKLDEEKVDVPKDQQ